MIAHLAPLLLALLPLDLQPPPPAPAASHDLEVRLELAPGEGGWVRYRIVHTFHGAKPMRFVTGASDRNCEDPIDVLVGPGGATVKLYSNLPCGGFAFESSRRVQPGESWTIAGQVQSGPVIARYCPRAEDLKRVDPAMRAVADPPWWLGCVDSPKAAAAAPFNASTPERAWELLLEAMRAGDLPGVTRLTTAGGFLSLRGAASGEDERALLARLGRAWASWELRMGKVAGDRVEARLGPRVKEHSLAFVRLTGGWRLDRWTPGE